MIWVSMSQSWVDELEATEYPWSHKLANVWRLKGLSNVQEVRGWSLEFRTDYRNARSRTALIPEGVKISLDKY